MSDGAFTAVQDDPASFVMDWPVFDQQVGDTSFRGTVFVLDSAGVRVGDATMRGPDDGAADEALRRLGWARTGGWRADEFGRPSARVERRELANHGPRPVRPSRSMAVSMSEEASLHIG